MYAAELDALKACNGNKSAAARKLGIARTTLIGRLEQLERIKGDAVKAPADGFAVVGTSTLYDAESGEAKLQWVKTARDRERQLEIITEACRKAITEVGSLPRIKAPKQFKKDLLACVPMGDPHVGLYAWAKEAGEDWDADKCAEAHFAAIDRLVDTAPACGTAVLLNLGDFFHSDTMDNKTRRSGNVLDVDTRWARVLEIGVQMMVRCIRRMAEKHQKVIVRNNIGNHDEHSSIMLALTLEAFFKDNPRITIDTSPSPFWYYQDGKVLLGSTHGDRTKPADLPGIMAADRSQEWGAATFRHWYIGHVHHQSKHEFRGCTVESFRTLAASDAWHHGQGYRSGRDMRCIVHHSEVGEIESHRVGIEML